MGSLLSILPSCLRQKKYIIPQETFEYIDGYKIKPSDEMNGIYFVEVDLNK